MAEREGFEPFIIGNIREQQTASRAQNRWNFNANTLNALETHGCVKNTHACVLPLFSHPKMWYNMDTSLRVEILRKKTADSKSPQTAVCFFRASEKAVGSRLFFFG